MLPAPIDPRRALCDLLCAFGLGTEAGPLPLRVTHEGLPLCLMGEQIDLASGLRAHDFAWMSEANEQELFPVDDADLGEKDNRDQNIQPAKNALTGRRDLVGLGADEER